MNQSHNAPVPSTGSRRMAKDSIFYEKVVPLLLIGLGIVTLALIVFAAGVLLGFVAWQ